MTQARLPQPQEAERGAAELGEPPLPPASYCCDSCGDEFVGLPAGAGLFVWTRGEEVRYEEPPLCEACAGKITIGALIAFWEPEEE